MKIAIRLECIRTLNCIKDPTEGMYYSNNGYLHCGHCRGVWRKKS